MWNIETGSETVVFKGHENAVFSVAFNYPKWYVGKTLFGVFMNKFWE